MGNYNLGSFEVEISKLIDNIPLSLSGTNMYPTINRALVYVNKFAGTSVGSDSVPEPYHDPVIHKTLSQLARTIADLGADTEGLKLGDFNFKNGGASSINTATSYYKDLADEEAENNIGKEFNSFQLFG